MNKYKFVAVDKDKKKIKGYVDASSQDELRRIISFHNYYLVKYKLVKKEERKFISATVTQKDIREFCKNMSLMLKTNQKLDNVISLLEATSRNKGIKEFLSYTKESLNQGRTFTDCMKKYKKYFSDIVISMVEVGEKSGNLHDVFEYLSNYYENNSKIRSKIINALIYPTILLFMAFVIMIVMCLFVLPMYSKIFIENNIELPIYTKVLFTFSDFIKSNIIYVVLLTTLFLLLSLLFMMSKRGKTIISLILSKLPFIRLIYKQFNIYLISSSLEVMLFNKLSIIDAINILVLSFNNKYLIKKFKWILDELRRGETLHKSFESIRYFPKMFIEMIRNGESTNQLALEVKSASLYFYEKLNNTLTRLSIFVEPILIIFISILVGVIMVSVFMPMLSLLSGLS